MRPTPIVLLVGEAGSGKDTVADMLCKHAGSAIKIAQADPMKRFVQKLWPGVSNEDLWGPSELRNKPNRHIFLDSRCSGIGFNGPNYLRESLDRDFSSQELDQLDYWYMNLPRGKELTPRFVLQTLGTEFGRRIDRDIWSNCAISTAKKLLGGGFTYTPADGLVESPDFQGYSVVVITDGRFRNEIINVKSIGGQVINIVNPSPNDSVDQAGVKGHASEQEQKSVPKFFFDRIFLNRKLGLDELDRRVYWLFYDLFYDVFSF